jgi:uncharacterized protein (DUF1697 family)
MTRHVALLRGINVGRARRVAMSDLRSLLTSLGYTNARTLLNSGNAVFDAPSGRPAEIAAQIHSAMAARLGVSAQVVVKPACDISASVAENPWTLTVTDPSRLLVVFTQTRDDLASLAQLKPRDWAPEAFALGAEAAYLWCADGILQSKLAQDVGRLLGERGTTRNWSTVLKLDALIRSGAG